MKRYIIPAILASLLTFSLLPGATYTYVVKELSQTFQAVQTFAYGLTMTETTGTISGVGVHLQYNADTECFQTWKDGSLDWQLCNGYAVPPKCASDIYQMPLGGYCRDYTEAQPRLLMRTAAGIVEVN